MRARYPDHEGDVVRDGVRIHYYVYGQGERTIVLLPTWSIVHARNWKMQVPYLCRSHRVITIDGRGNGRSDRPAGPEAYRLETFVADVLAVMDATDTERAVIAGTSMGGLLGGLLAGLHPERVEGAVLIAPSVPFGPAHPGRDPARLLAQLDAHEGWDQFNVHYWRTNYPEFAQWFMERVHNEPHSSRGIEEGVAWALETDGETLANTMLGRFQSNLDAEAVYGSIRCPVLVIHGEQDEVVPHGKGAAVAELTGGALVTIEGGGHSPAGRHPVLVNRLIKNFADRVGPYRPQRTRWSRGLARRKKALYLSSPIGLGHARRDLAVARELRALRPDVQIDWLTQDPVTTFLEGTGERVHPAGRLLVNESAHLESEAGEHDLHAFQTVRTMDEIMVSNFMVFQEVVDEGHYDLVIADEAWDVDHFWHENPELKRGALAWFTDFVGFLPFAEGGEREADLTADYNAEMIEHWERYPWLRDRALFVGSPEDVVPGRFGPELPEIQAWTRQHYEFPGYISGYDPAAWGDPAALRADLGYRADERVCIVSVGGSAVGAPLLRRILDAWPTVHRKLPELRLVLVTGPRIDPATLKAPRGRTNGVEVRGYVPELHKHLTVCDLALVQGGLTTCMELTAARRPFLYFPLQRHFEQCFHVHHRLQRYGAGRRMDYASSDPDAIAAAMVAELARPLDYRPVETDGAARAAALLAEML